jgi:hypothetical protein
VSADYPLGGALADIPFGGQSVTHVSRRMPPSFVLSMLASAILSPP